MKIAVTTLIGLLAAFSIAAAPRAWAQTAGAAATLQAQGLYVASGACDIVLTEFQGNSLAHSGKPPPTLKPVGSTEAFVGGVAFDPQQNLWVSFCGGAPFVDGAVLGLSPLNLKQLKAHRKKITVFAALTDASIHCPKGVAFDHAGNLWTVNQIPVASLSEYSAADIAHGGSPSPIATHTINGISNPRGLKFDGAGNLWITDFGLQDTDEITAGQLDQPGPFSPNLMVDPPPHLDNSFLPYSNPSDIAFDGGGNMWVSYDSGGPQVLGGIVEYAAADLSGTGAMTIDPVAVIQASRNSKDVPSIIGPQGLAFDHSGNLWVANSGLGANIGTTDGSIVEFARSQLSNAAPSPPALQWLPNEPRHGGCNISNFVRPLALTFGRTLK